MALRIDRGGDRIYNSQTYQIRTPDGMMYINLLEDKDGSLVMIDVQIGKAGGSLRVWAHCMGRMLTMLLEHGAYIDDLVEELSSQTTDRLAIHQGNVKVRSGPEGIYVALMKYKLDKYERLKKELHVTNEFRGSIRHA